MDSMCSRLSILLMIAMCRCFGAQRCSRSWWCWWVSLVQGLVWFVSWCVVGSLSFMCVQSVVFGGWLFSRCSKFSWFTECVVLAVSPWFHQCLSFCGWTLQSALMMCSKPSGCYLLFVLALCWGRGNNCRRLYVFCIVWLAVSLSPGFRQFKVYICFLMFIVCICFHLVLQTSRLLESCIPPGGYLFEAFWQVFNHAPRTRYNKIGTHERLDLVHLSWASQPKQSVRKRLPQR